MQADIAAGKALMIQRLVLILFVISYYGQIPKTQVPNGPGPVSGAGSTRAERS
jgi:hypothetical protein